MRELNRYNLKLHRFSSASDGLIRNVSFDVTTARSDDGAIVYFEDIAQELAIAQAARTYIESFCEPMAFGLQEVTFNALVAAVEMECTLQTRKI